VELMVAVTITGILLIAAGIIHVTSARLWIKGNDKVLLQAESSYMLTVLTTAVREATEDARILEGGQKLELERKDKNGNLEWTKVFYKEGNNLSYMVNDGAANILISGILHSLAFTFPEKDASGADIPGVIRMEMVLQKKGESFAVQKTIDMRNFRL